MDIQKPVRTPRWKTLPILAGGALIALLVTGALVFVGGRSHGSPLGEGSIVTVEAGDVVPSVTALGSVQPLGLKRITARSHGQVIEITAQPGASVKQGAVLMTLRSDQLATELAAARIRYSQAQSAVSIARAQAFSDAGAEKSSLIKAETALRFAREEYEARQRVFEQGVVSRMQVEEAKAKLAIAQADLGAARVRVEATKRLSRARIQSQLDESQICLEEYERLRGDAAAQTIMAPEDGIVSQVDVDLGGDVSPGTTLLKFVNGRGFFVRLNVPEDEATAVRVGATAQIEASGQHFTGQVLRVHPTVKDGYVPVDVSLSSAHGSSPPIDSTVRARILGDVARDALFVPAETNVRPRSRMTIDVRPAGGAWEHVPVKFGNRVGDRILIRSGARAGDQLRLPGGIVLEGSATP